MMIRLLRRSCLYLTTLMLAGITFAMGIPYDNSQVLAFMSAEENCSGTCLLGVRPGTSTVGETMILLRSHAWVDEVRQNAPGSGYAQISWTWSGQQPTVIDPSRPGRITFYWEDDVDDPKLVDSIIETITVYTTIRIDNLQNSLGEASHTASTTRPDGDLGYSIMYNMPRGMLNITVEMPCPVDMLTYWNAKARLTFTIGRVAREFVHLRDMIRMC